MIFIVVVLLAEGYFLGIGNFVILGSFLGTICVNFFAMAQFTFREVLGLQRFKAVKLL